MAVAGAPVGMGASLGGLAMLHAQRRHPDAFAGLFLQSASFFMPRHDHMEKGFHRFGRIVRFVRGVVRDERAFDHPVPATLTVGADEDNVHNNRRVAAALKLQGYAAELIEAGRVPPHRIALLDPGRREEWYSASAFYARALTGEVLPAVGRAVAVAGAPVGMGASLGGLAMLHAQRRSPEAFSGLFLQSASFFMPRFDHMEKDFPRYGRIVRFVRGIVRETAFERPVPATLTCATEEDNVHNNRRVTAALRLQGYRAALVETPGGHDFATWGAALERHLPDLLAAAWGED